MLWVRRRFVWMCRGLGWRSARCVVSSTVDVVKFRWAINRRAMLGALPAVRTLSWKCETTFIRELGAERAGTRYICTLVYLPVLAPCWQEIGGVGASVPSLALHVGVRRNWRGEDYCNRRCRSPCARINARRIRRCSMREVLNRCKLGVCVRERICRGHARNGALAPAGKRSGPGGGEDGTVHEYIHNLSVDFHASWVCSRGHHARCDSAGRRRLQCAPSAVYWLRWGCLHGDKRDPGAGWCTVVCDIIYWRVCIGREASSARRSGGATVPCDGGPRGTAWD